MLKENRAARHTIGGQIAEREKRVKPLKVRLMETLLTLKKLAVESFRTKAELPVKMSVVEKSLTGEKTCVERMDCKLATEAKKGRQLVAEAQKASETASCQLTAGKDSLHDLPSKVVAFTAKQIKWYISQMRSRKCFKQLKLTWLYSCHFGKLLWRT